MSTTLASAARDERGGRNAVREMLLSSAKNDVAEQTVDTRREQIWTSCSRWTCLLSSLAEGARVDRVPAEKISARA